MTKLITSEKNVQYLSGFSGSVGILLLQGEKTTLFVDGRYTEQAKNEVKKGIRIVEAPLGGSLFDAAISFVKKDGPGTLGYEDDKLSAYDFLKLQRALSLTKLYSISSEIRQQRSIKSHSEIELIRKAALIADLSFDCVVRIIRAGLTEKDVSAHIDYLMKTFKADYPAFETLVSSGVLSAYPHGKPSDKILKDRDVIVMDFGARYKGYNSDITRMACIGEPSKKHQKIYDHVRAAQESAIAAVKEGAPASTVDAAARKVLKKAGMEKYFKHGTGHGIGLAVHEGPRVSFGSKDILKAGMVITIEPGVYIPGFGGFRVEDMVLVKKGGHEVLTRSPKDLAVL